MPGALRRRAAARAGGKQHGLCAGLADPAKPLGPDRAGLVAAVVISEFPVGLDPRTVRRLGRADDGPRVRPEGTPARVENGVDHRGKKTEIPAFAGMTWWLV